MPYISNCCKNSKPLIIPIAMLPFLSLLPVLLTLFTHWQPAKAYAGHGAVGHHIGGCPGGGGFHGGCGGGCGGGHGCFQGGCCAFPACPGGGHATSFGCGGCHGTCHQGCCCPPPVQHVHSMVVHHVSHMTVHHVVCPTGIVSHNPCGGGCGNHHGCFQGCCCPMAHCPSGGWATDFCHAGSQCGGSCHQGCCCPQHAGHHVQHMARPGCGCGPRCCGCGCEGGGGYGGGWGGGHHRHHRRRRPGKFGSQFPKHFKDDNHDYLLMRNGSYIIKTKDLNANVTTPCNTDCSCSPNELCIGGECRLRMVPGQQGCLLDRQCSFDCLTAYCDQQTFTCRCRPGQFAFVEVGLCYKTCPEGTVPTKDGLCNRVNVNDLLFQNRWIRLKIERSHTCGNVQLKDCNVPRNNTII